MQDSVVLLISARAPASSVTLGDDVALFMQGCSWTDCERR